MYRQFCMFGGVVCQVCIADGGEDAAVTEDLLDLKKVDAGFDQMRCVAVS